MVKMRVIHDRFGLNLWIKIDATRGKSFRISPIGLLEQKNQVMER